MNEQNAKSNGDVHRMEIGVLLKKNSELSTYMIIKGTVVAQWLRCCATNRKVAGSIPYGVTGIFH